MELYTHIIYKYIENRIGQQKSEISKYRYPKL